MKSIVGVTRGSNKFESFKELLRITNFDDTLSQEFEKSKKNKSDFKIIIKPNMMTYVSHKGYEAIVTDKELVENLVDHMIQLGFSDISVCESQIDVGRMLKNHNVHFVSQQIGYKPGGRYKIVDLTLESLPFKYAYKGKNGKIKKWKDKVGKTWKEADFRITFAKLKTHEHDWMTLGLKNVYGCFPRPGKVCNYHIKNEVFDVTARMLFNFPLHFCLIDGWVGSDGFQGYKLANPKPLKMLFGGKDTVAVDTEVFKRAGLNPKKSRFLDRTVAQLSDGQFPEYVVKGDEKTLLKDTCDWENLEDKIVESIDCLEEVYIGWAFLNLKAISELVDYNIFPPRSIIHRFMVWLSKKLYGVFKIFPFYRRLYKRKK
jgi:uncharacterized protein (DUF362 family)